MKNMVNVRQPSRAMRYQAPQARYSRSQFDLSHNHKTSFDAGRLIPYLVEEVVPGDTYTCKLTALIRVFSPLQAPIMDDIRADIDFFFVPNRLLWDNWENFLGAHDDAGAQDTTYTIPKMSTGNTVSHDAGVTNWTRLAAYMGLPDGLVTTNEDINALPFRAYGLIYNEWYRDQNVINSLTVATDNGPQSAAAITIQKSAKQHDYFTSALPYLQKGTAQEVALTDPDIVTDIGAGSDLAIYSTNDSAWHEIDADDPNIDVSATSSTSAFRMYADMSQIGLTINALRQAAAIQRLLEKDARAGTRHPELIRAHFGVTVPDYRTQRPEYLGGGTGFVNVSPVANTTAIDSLNDPATVDRYPGELAGTAAGVLTASWAKSFVEHGYILGILRARGAVSYQQGTDRMWTRADKYDFLWPELAGLGEQAILNKELWYEGDATDDNVFGYQERYAEYRYKKSLVTGVFNSDGAASIDHWHLAEDFASQPALNSTFIEDATPMSRVQAFTTADDFIIDGRFDMKVARVLPVRPQPSLMSPRF